jgi:TRAP-type C4-dicarboxylate transport system substrate-binding protein
MIPRRTTLLSALAAAALAAATWSSAATAQGTKTVKLTIASGYGVEVLGVRMLDEFLIPEINDQLKKGKTGITIDWRRAYGGTMVAPGAESEAIKTGKADIGLVMTYIETQRFPLHQVGFAAPFVGRDIFIAARLPDDIQRKQKAMMDVWDKNGMVYLGGLAIDSFQIFTKTPLNGPQDLKGKRIGVLAANAHWLAGTGAEPVIGTFETFKADIASGKSDGAILPSSVAYDQRVVDVAPSIHMVDYGAQFIGALVINKKSLAKLPAKARAVIREAGKNYLFRVGDQQGAAGEAALFGVLAQGGKARQPDAAGRAKWAGAITDIAQDWAGRQNKAGLPGTAVLDDYVGSWIAAGQPVGRDWRQP